jgi:ribosomal-protein-alanine N-acetyltransferase
MVDPFRIRPSVPADLGELTRLEGVAFSDPWSPAMIAEAIADRAAVALVAADEGGGLVGSVVARVVADEAEILTIAVAPAMRRRGLGRRLLDQVLSALRERGAGSVWLEVRASNLGARRMYEAAGFVAVGVRRGYYRRPTEDALLLSSRLDAVTGTEMR